jgi:hypothetical protein
MRGWSSFKKRGQLPGQSFDVAQAVHWARQPPNSDIAPLRWWLLVSLPPEKWIADGEKPRLGTVPTRPLGRRSTPVPPRCSCYTVSIAPGVRSRQPTAGSRQRPSRRVQGAGPAPHGRCLTNPGLHRPAPFCAVAGGEPLHVGLSVCMPCLARANRYLSSVCQSPFRSVDPNSSAWVHTRCIQAREGQRGHGTSCARSLQGRLDARC